MSIFRNLSGAFVPVREQRSNSGSLNVLNAEVVLDVNGDQSALVYIASSAFIGTIEFTGSADGVNFMPLMAYPYAVGSAGGTLPISAQPLLAEGLVAANTSRAYSIPCGQIRKVRVRVSAYTSGSALCTINSDTMDALNPGVNARPSTVTVSATGVVGAAVTATLPAVAGLRHIVDFIQVTRSATAALTAAATPVLVTTAGLPGNPVLTFGQDVAGIGIDKEVKLDFGSSGLAANALGAAETVNCPAYVGVIWRVNIAYRLGA